MSSKIGNVYAGWKVVAVNKRKITVKCQYCGGERIVNYSAIFQKNAIAYHKCIDEYHPETPLEIKVYETFKKCDYNLRATARALKLSEQVVQRNLSSCLIKLNSKPLVVKNGKKEQLCLSCRKSTNSNLCCWVDKFKAVEGWTAEKVKYTGFMFKETYNILECPNYERD